MRTLFASALLVVALGACATPGERTAIGAGGGAAVGAGVGALAGGWEGAAIGAHRRRRRGWRDRQLSRQASAGTAGGHERPADRERHPGGPQVVSAVQQPTARSSSPPRWSRSRNSATSSPDTPTIAFASRGIPTRRDPRRTMSSCRCIARWPSATCLRPAASTRGRCSSKARERRGPSPTTRLLKDAPRTDASSCTSTFRRARERSHPAIS